MPITGVASWLPVIDEFLQHWTDVNAALAPGSLTLLGGAGGRGDVLCTPVPLAGGLEPVGFGSRGGPD